MNPPPSDSAQASHEIGWTPIAEEAVRAASVLHPKEGTLPHPDRRRVLTGYGRSHETPEELVLELLADSSGYVAHGDRAAITSRELRAVILGILPRELPGLTSDEILAAWPSKPPPRNQKLLKELRRGADEGDWVREGSGRKGSPFRYWLRVPGQ